MAVQVNVKNPVNLLINYHFTMKTKNFRTKVSIACGHDDLRPIMQHIYFDDGFAVATDAHLLLKQSLREHGFLEHEIEIMNGKYLHREVFDEIYRYDSVLVSDDGFTCLKGEVKALFPFSDIGDYKFPNWSAVIPDLSDVQPITEIGINLNLLERAKKLTFSYTKSVRFRFKAKNKAILLDPTDNSTSSGAELILIMPALLENNV